MAKINTNILISAFAIVVIVIGIVIFQRSDNDRNNKNWKLFGTDYYSNTLTCAEFGYRLEFSRTFILGIVVGVDETGRKRDC